MSEHEREISVSVVRVGDAHEIRIDSADERHRAACTCGWTGKLRHRYESAADDLRDHVTDQYRQPARELRGRIRP